MKKKQNWTLIIGRLIKYADPGKRGLAMAEKAVLDAIAEHLGDKQYAWPGYGTIAHMAGCDRATAIRTVAKLKARGILTVAPTDDQESNRYEIDGKALGQLITKKKYQTRAQKLLARLGVGQPATGGTTPPPSGTVPPVVVAGRHQGGGTVRPEVPKEGPTPLVQRTPHPEPAGRDDLRSRGGSPTPEELRPHNHLKNPELASIWEKTEAITGPLPASSRPIGSVCASIVTLCKSIRDSEGRFPLPEEVASAAADFASYRGWSWGLLSAGATGDKFRAALLQRVRNSKMVSKALVLNDNDRHDAELGERKRESAAGFRGRWTDENGEIILPKAQPKTAAAAGVDAVVDDLLVGLED